MGSLIEAIKNTAWFCEDHNDTEQMIEFLENQGIRWRNNCEVKNDKAIYCTIADGCTFLIDTRYRLVFTTRATISSEAIIRSDDCKHLPLVSWTELKSAIGLDSNQVSLTEYLLEVG